MIDKSGEILIRKKSFVFRFPSARSMDVGGKNKKKRSEGRDCRKKTFHCIMFIR